MKYVKKGFLKALILGLSIIPISSFAANCYLNNAHINEVLQWSDGYIFVVLDGNTNCSCSIKNRLAFHKNDNEKFLISASLTALTTGKTVDVIGEDSRGSCPVHGNTAKLLSLTIKAN